MQYKAIIFDLDGVIIDSEPLHEEAMRLAFAERGVIIEQELLNAIKGKSDKDIIEDWIRQGAIGTVDVSALILRKHEIYTESLDRLTAIPGAIDFIREVSEVYPLALTTSAIRLSQERAFSDLGLDAYFKLVVTAEDITRAKPDPEPYQLTVARLGFKPEECLVIEDSVNGVRSAVAAGCFVVGLTTSFLPEELRAEGAHLVVDTFEALAGRLARKNSSGANVCSH